MIKFITGIAITILFGAVWYLLEMVKAEMVGFGYIVNLIVMLAMASMYCFGKIRICDDGE